MTQAVPRAVVEGFYKALAVCDLKAIEPYLDDDVVWTISGPVDVLKFCGRHVGKENVLKLIERDVPMLLDDRRFNPDTMLVDGDRVAVLGKVTARLHDGGHAISYRIAQFLRFRDDKVVDYVSLLDSFDAVEQLLGQPLALPDGMRSNSDLIAL